MSRQPITKTDPRLTTLNANYETLAKVLQERVGKRNNKQKKEQQIKQTKRLLTYYWLAKTQKNKKN